MTMQLTEGSLAAIIEGHFPGNPVFEILKSRGQQGASGGGTGISVNVTGGSARCSVSRGAGPRQPPSRLQLKRLAQPAPLGAPPCRPLRVILRRALGLPATTTLRLTVRSRALAAAQTMIKDRFPGNLVWQILGSKAIGCAKPQERIRLLVSDGCHMSSFVMLAAQINDKFTSGEISDYTVVQINDFAKCVVNKGTERRSVIIIKDLTVLAKGTEVGKKIGCPVIHPSVVELPQNPLSLMMSELSLDDGL